MVRRRGFWMAMLVIGLGGWALAAFVLLFRDETMQRGVLAPADVTESESAATTSTSGTPGPAPVVTVGSSIRAESTPPIFVEREVEPPLSEREPAPSPPADPPLSEPLIRELADPEVVLDGGFFYAYGTNQIPYGVVAHNIPVYQSDDLETWHHRGDALPDLPSWAVSGTTWAPGVIRIDADAWVLYYSALLAGENPLGLKCIGRGTADNPLGPFVDRSPEALVCEEDQGGAIDPSPFRDGEQLWLSWKNDGNVPGVDVETWLYSQRLTSDGLRLVGEPGRLAACDCEWEYPLIEQPEFLRDEFGQLWLFFSANWWDTEHYGIGLARCLSPQGGCRKVSVDGPWFEKDPTVDGPGAASFFEDGNGTVYMAYHGWEPGTVGTPEGNRSLRLAVIRTTSEVPVPVRTRE